MCGHRLGGELGEGRGASRQSCTEGEGEARALQAGAGLEGGKGSQVWSALRQGSWGGWVIPPPPVFLAFRGPVCLDVLLSFAELKRGVPQDSTSSPKLDRYRLARQLTERAIKVNALWGLVGGGRFLKMAIDFGMWRVGLGSCPGPRPGPHGVLPSDSDLSCASEIGNAFQTGKARTREPCRCLPRDPVWLRAVGVGSRADAALVPHGPRGDAVRTDNIRVRRGGLRLRTATPSHGSGSFWGSAPPGRGEAVPFAAAERPGLGERRVASVPSRSGCLHAGALSTRRAASGEEAAFRLHRVPGPSLRGRGRGNPEKSNVH